MTTGAVLGLAGAIGTRYLVSQSYGVTFGTGLVYNSFDVGVTLYVTKSLTDSTGTVGTQAVLGAILISRILGIVSGKAASAPFGNVNLSTAVALSAASLVANVFIRMAVGQIIQQPVPVEETVVEEQTLLPPTHGVAHLYTTLIMIAQDCGKIVEGLLYA